jgi:hypothetical protein
VKTVGNLAGKTIGMVQGQARSNDRILDQILTYYEIPAHTVCRITDFQEAPTVGPDKLDALDQEVDELCAVALTHITYATMDAEQFQVCAGIVTQVRQALDKRCALLR